MPWQKGQRHSQETRDRISDSQRRNWAERRDWTEASAPILNAANAGDYEAASEALQVFMYGRSLDELHADQAVEAQDLDDLAAATQRLHAEKRAGLVPDVAETRRVVARVEGRRVSQAEPYRPAALGRHIANRMSWELTDAEARQLGHEAIQALREARNG
jgi:hypothetical protein